MRRVTPLNVKRLCSTSTGERTGSGSRSRTLCRPTSSCRIRCSCRAATWWCTEVSHGACCDRSRRKGIAGVRTRCGRHDPGGQALPDARVGRVLGDAADEPRDCGDVRRVVLRGRPRRPSRPRDARGGGDVGQDARRGRATDEVGQARRAQAERGVVQDRPAYPYTWRRASRARARRCAGCAKRWSSRAPS